jgi:hypothetical protein
VPDISNLDLAAALSRRGCPVCRVLAADEERYVATFAREGRFAARARARFFAAGGYCRRHAELLVANAARAQTGMAIVDLYGRLARYDRMRLAALRTSWGGRFRRRVRVLPRSRWCPACVDAEQRLDRKSAFLVDLLAEDGAWSAYAASDGLCLAHLIPVAEAAQRVDTRIADRLLEDWCHRVRDLELELAEYDRKRDYRYAHEPKGEEQDSWRRIIRRYVGEDLVGRG